MCIPLPPNHYRVNRCTHCGWESFPQNTDVIIRIECCPKCDKATELHTYRSHRERMLGHLTALVKKLKWTESNK